MLKNKTYTCEICKTKPDQLSHHKTHLETQKHKDRKELFELKLLKLTSDELQKLYNTLDVNIIIDENETNTFIYTDNKKLINTKLNDKKFNIDTEMTEENKQKIEKSQNVSNKEALKDKIHEIHNYLRNNGAGYGMNSLKVFNLLYGLKKIEEKRLLDQVNLKRPDCEFSYLLKIANQNKDEELTELIFNSVLDSIHNSPIKTLLFYEIPKNIKSSVFAHLIKEINKITIIEKTCNVLLSGKIYEYFIGRDESAISELGAYFTDRHIVDYIYKKLDPEINEDGSIDSMIDMFGGSGGFTTGYINYLNDKYDDINWKDNINKIYHFDMNEDVIKSAGLEFFCLTGVLPNMKDNLKYKNSFTDEFNNKKFKKVITNPPYGGDKISQSDAQMKRKKIKDYIKKELLTLKDELKIKTRLRQIKKIEDQEKQEKKDSDKTKVSVEMCSQRIIKYAKDNKLTGNDKESSSLILIMDMVDVNGTAIGVLKEGVFFNKTYKDIRKCLVENFNVREIISVPQDQFENTSTKTSIVLFDNTKEKTTSVKFSELTVEKYTEDKFEEIAGEIVLTESKDDISNISDRLISEATKDEILKNSICSLNGKDYNKREIVVGEGYELVKISELGVINSEKKLTKNEYNYIEISDINENSITNFEKLTKDKLPVNAKNIVEYGNILISCVRPKKSKMLLITENIKNIDNYVFSTALANIKLKDKNSAYYVYSILYNLVDNFENELCNGSSYPRFKPTDLLNVKIPIPKNENKIKEWVDKISKPYDKKNENEQKIEELEEKIKDKIKYISEKEECDEVELGSICDINPESLKENQFTQINYIDISSVKEGKINNIQLLTDNFPSRAQRIIKKNDILFSTVRPNLKGYTFINDEIINGVATSGFVVIRSKSIHPKYIYSLITDDSVIDFLMENSTGTSYPAVNSSIFRKIKIKIPKNKKLIQKLEPIFEEIIKLQSEMKESDLQYKKLIKELSEEAISNNKQELKLSDKIENIDVEESNIEIKKSKVSKKKDKSKTLID
jgi:type I restriction-modification system DNA methylase subunit